MNPDSSADLLKQATSLHRAGQFVPAEEIYRRVLRERPDHAEAMNFLGLLLHQTDRTDEAIPLMRRSIELRPDVVKFHTNLSGVYQQSGDSRAAADEARIAIKLAGDNPMTHYALGVALADCGDVDGALAAYRRAIELNPRLAAAHENIGVLLLRRVRADEALPMLRRAVELDPQSVGAAMNLGSALMSLGELDEAIALFERADALPTAGSNGIVALHQQSQCANEELLTACRQWAQRHAEPITQRSSRPPRRADIDVPRIGFVSPDFRLHSVATFLLPLIATIDRSQFHITCYSDVATADSITARFQAHADQWRDVRRLSDAKLDRLIRDDQIDVLIDLAGHTADSRLMLFARTPAPVQIAYLGWQGTTGLSAIDFRITDAHLDPPGETERFHSERLLRLPETFAIYQPPQIAPEVSPSPATQNGFVTFGSFAKLEKINDACLAMWSRALHAVDRSQLRLCAKGLHSQRARDRITQLFHANGIDETRLRLIGAMGFTDYLGEHAKIDLMLDTFPFNGHTTTCHGLWMGVPTLTLAGDRYAARMGLSVMTNLGLPEFIVTSPDAFVDRAAQVAHDVPALTNLRRSLRQRMRDSALMDAPRFARSFESILRSAVA